MKAEPSAQLALLDLQEHDSAIAQQRHRRASLSEIAVIQEADAKLAEHDRSRVALSTRVSDLEREQRRIDGEVEQVRARRTRNEERMASGAITNPKDLENLQHEVGALQRRISALEDEELEVMEALEQAQSELDAVVGQIAEVRVGRDTAAAGRDDQWREIDERIAQQLQSRAGVAGGVPADLIALYEKLAPSHAGVAVASLSGSRCEGCRLDITGADLRELQQAPADEVLRCPECGRILVRRDRD